MNAITKYSSALGVITALLLGGCGSTNTMPYPPNVATANSGNTYSGYGVVQSIDLVQHDNSANGGNNIGLGTIAGAVIGGVVGNQVGAGRGNTLATVAGAAGGAYVGHQLENRQSQKSDAYRIVVRMDDGSTYALTQSTTGGFRVGDQVRIDNGVIQRY